MKAHVLLSLWALCVSMTGVSYGDQLDQEAQKTRPAGVLVNVDAQSHRITVYQTESIDRSIVDKSIESLSAPDQLAKVQQMVAETAVPANRIGEMIPSGNELDREASTSAWHRRYWGRGWGWRGWGGYYYNTYNWYQPYYYPGRFYYNDCYDPCYYNYGWSFRIGYRSYGWYY